MDDIFISYSSGDEVPWLKFISLQSYVVEHG
jgi:hypothetical protein